MSAVFGGVGSCLADMGSPARKGPGPRVQGPGSETIFLDPGPWALDPWRDASHPAIPEPQVAAVTLYLKGCTLHAEGSSRELHHSIKLCSLELSRQVKRHQDKKRRRREARSAPPQPAV